MTATASASLVRPPRLRNGDTVAVVSPSGPVPQALADAGVEFVSTWGVDVKIGQHALKTDARYDYLAGSDAQRAAAFEDAWCDPSVAAVLCMRGGYGAQRFVDQLDWARMREAGPKILVGYSDITALHQAVAAKLGLVTFYGPMPGTTGFTTELAAAERLRVTLFEPEAAMTLSRVGAHPLVGGTARGITTGGCLALLAGDVGTPTQPARQRDGIAMLEDVGEKEYRIDGFITHLLRSGWFEGVRGVVLGSWADCDPVENLLTERLGPLGVPILSEFGFGHCVDPITVPLGLDVTFDADAGTVTLTEPALAER